MSTGGEVANALVCKTSIPGFNSRPVLQNLQEGQQAAGRVSESIKFSDSGAV
jgi:hypothetical protein